MRVIAGTFKGMPLKSLSTHQTRPTGDKVKESLFQMLGPFFPSGSILDLYGGSGSIAIEAISRGMVHAVIVESHVKAQEVIMENIQKTHQPERFDLLRMDAQTALNQITETFDLVFLDPPYAQQNVETDIEKLSERKLVKPGRVIVCETDAAVSLPASILNFEKIIAKTYGNTTLHFYRNEDHS